MTILTCISILGTIPVILLIKNWLQHIASNIFGLLPIIILLIKFSQISKCTDSYLAYCVSSVKLHISNVRINIISGDDHDVTVTPLIKYSQ